LTGIIGLKKVQVMSIKSSTVVLAALLLAMLCGCVTSGSGKQSTVSGGVPANSQAIMIINGEKIFPAELLSFPVIRGPLRQYIYRVSLAQEAKKRGITLDESRLEEVVQGEKELALNRDQTWEEYLDELNQTEAELIEEKKADVLFDQLVAADVDTSDEALRKFWDENKADTIDRYIKKYFLPDSERDKLTFEDCKDFVRERVLQREMFPKSDALFKRLFNDSTLELLCFSSDEEANHFENLILYNLQEQIKAEAEEAQQQAGESGLLAPETE